MDEKESTMSGSISNSAESTQSPTPVSSAGEMVIPLAVSAQNINPSPPPLPLSENTNTNTNSVPNASAGDALMINKKKRGRPKKYDADGTLRVKPSPYQSLISSSMLQPQGESGFSLTFGSPGAGHAAVSSAKRGRGRPPGSGTWQSLGGLGEILGGTTGGDFAAHVVTVNTGDDVAGTILSFSQKGSRGICVLSANGSVSNVALRQPGSAGGVLTYEGRFEILTLTGSYTITETMGARSRTGGLSVSLAAADGKVIGGSVAGLLLAASPIQIVIGSFTPSCVIQQKKKYQRPNVTTNANTTPCSAPAKVDATSAVFGAQSIGKTESNGCWNGLNAMANQKMSPDINVSILGEDGVAGVL